MRLLLYLKEMRIHHYIKNLLVFAPVICSGQLFSGGSLLNAVFAFLSFCFLSSAVYFINDLKDIENDRHHPEKKDRPIARGDISKPSAISFTVALIVIALLLGFFSFSIKAMTLLILYLVINIGYSFGLKDIPLLDVAILASGYLIRLSYGGIVTNIVISNWLYLVVISLSFYLGFGKRRNEIIMLDGTEVKTRKVVGKYSLPFLDKSMYLFMGLTFVFYALWTVDETTITVYQSDRLIWTVPIVVLILLRYSMSIEEDSNGDPVDVLFHDIWLIILCILYVSIMFVMLYIIG